MGGLGCQLPTQVLADQLTLSRFQILLAHPALGSFLRLDANHMPRIMPMMMTPAGTLKPAKVFIIGAGVKGGNYDK